jgi:hypothetical protein
MIASRQFEFSDNSTGFSRLWLGSDRKWPRETYPAREQMRNTIRRRNPGYENQVRFGGQGDFSAIVGKTGLEQQYKLNNEGVINYASRSKNYEIG